MLLCGGRLAHPAKILLLYEAGRPPAAYVLLLLLHIPSARLWLRMLALELRLSFLLLLMRRATLRQGEPSQARQDNQGIDSQMELDIFVMSAPVRQPLTTGCGTGCIQSVNGPRGKPVRAGDLLKPRSRARVPACHLQS